MKLRPCIDIHNGKIKQIVGSSLKDEGDDALNNFVSEKDGQYYAKFYEKDGLSGGHVIILNKKESIYYEETKRQALLVLNTSKGKWQIGGGITDENAKFYIDNGASHVIVTSFVFSNGKINMNNLLKLVNAVGKKHIVLDLSCKNINGTYYVVTDRWQNITTQEVNVQLFNELSKYCDEFLVHGVDVEGKNSGVDIKLIEIISDFKANKITYAGGIKSLEDIGCINEIGKGYIDITIGSALDIFGGYLEYKGVLKYLED